MQKAERVKTHKRKKVRLLNWLFKALRNGIEATKLKNSDIRRQTTETF